MHILKDREVILSRLIRQRNEALRMRNKYEDRVDALEDQINKIQKGENDG